MSSVVGGRPAVQPDRLRRAARVLWRDGAVVLAGLLLFLAFPPRTLWWTALPAFALLWWALQGVRARRGAVLGFVFGMAFFLPHLLWIQDFLGAQFGPWPWLGLSAVMAAFLAAYGAGVTLVTRLPGAPLWAAALFVLQESLRGRTPLNGFPWGRVAFGQVDGPYLPLAHYGGATLVTFAVVASGFCVAALLTRPREIRRAVPVLVIAIALVVVPAPPTDAQAGTRTVGTVQGNAPDDGLGLLGQRAEVRRNTLSVNAGLAGEIRAGTVPRPDFVVWPEGSTSTDGRDPVVDRAVADLGVPALVGAIFRGDGGTENSVVEWDPVTGAGERYAKQELVPFSERIPFRSISSAVTPFVDFDEWADMRAGTRPGVLDVAGTRVGLGICYEVAYDWVLREGTQDGAQMLVVPTDNAWFGQSEMTYQQLGMARLRAVENGRAVVVAALSGVSAVVEPDGSVARSTGMYTADTMVETVPLRTDITPATRIGGWVEAGFAATALAACMAGFLARRRRGAAGG
ncbi:apolipoprotein N-acyltransferase [Pseudonocardia nematodicida]|uniref:Apolipoprotein N-acyltransferase n=1 Tax=Pseudonocardia nematodicida TaxID=1206997 RepID=A0ABV1K957_9PSEU